LSRGGRDDFGGGLPFALRGAVEPREAGAHSSLLAVPLAAQALLTPLARPRDVADQRVHLVRGGGDDDRILHLVGHGSIVPAPDCVVAGGRAEQVISPGPRPETPGPFTGSSSRP